MFEFQPGKKHLLRLINAGGSSNQKFSIDGHKLIVVANDFTQVEPYEVDVVTLGVGQRSDVIVIAHGHSTDTAWMRSEIDVPCQNGTVYRALAKAIVHYRDAPIDAIPNTSGHTWKSVDCLNVSKVQSESSSTNLGPGSADHDNTYRCQTRTSAFYNRAPGYYRATEWNRQPSVCSQ
jgi:hypothetical protein